MHITPTLLLCLTNTATAAPQFTWPWGGGGGGSSGSGSGSNTNTANDITNKTPCKALTVIFARGTNERGNIGSVIGPPLRRALQARMGAEKVNYQGVAVCGQCCCRSCHPLEGNANGGGNGGSLMVSLAQQALQQCPSTTIILSGYSQGGSVVHKAGTLLTASTPIAAAVLFGDPANRSPVSNVRNLKQYCNSGDRVCEAPKSFAITAAHAAYGRNGNAEDAAAYISGVTGVV
ncbi:MAG: hypothetical protein LQ339_005926 [Xanthoria mediterranea]|nr:MAG: hypothetical protein LQ339_005926 [Xanthoria mediterranea]